MESAILTGRPLSPADVLRWTCPHDRLAGRGCVTCYQASADADPALPLWDVAVWFTIPGPIPIRALQDVHRHGRRFTLDQPSTPLIYLLSGQTRAGSGAEAVAGVAGFLLQNRHIVQEFTVTEIRAIHS
ncbi:hypothetical protein C1I98_27990 [Spongiactinospora gelatinilytica]|uniref:Uncharacterized protein n=1 Tax=Spongiactinospora gelatinilytica TaxID=2666298 RepID=A0A2W2FFW1_9ACTN|nr:hypothetical protein [Spongiactinospora gelatinilytica]PZG34461.1 hypothetical protein C1I98_27990 [Spongiactinospora gelatinilytica]